MLSILACRDRQPDDCERAFARLARIEPAVSAKLPSDAVEACRHERYATYDPVLRCAMDTETDDAAAACIEKLVKSVLRPSPEAVGTGINPLLDQR